MSVPAFEETDRLPPSVWIDLSSAYLRARFVITLVAAVAATIGGVLNGWVRGPWFLLIVLAGMVHAFVLKSKSFESVTAVLAFDAVLFAVVNVLTGILTVGLFSLTFLMVATAVLERGRRVHILWGVDVVLIGVALIVGNRLPLAEYTDRQRRLTEVIAVVFITWAAVSLTRTLASRLRAADVVRRVAELELQVEKRRFRALLEQSSDGLAVTDARLKIMELGVQNHRITGYGAEERAGGSMLDLVVSEDRSILVSAYRQVMENPRSPVFFEARIVRRDGEVRTMATSVRNLTSDPELRGLVFNFHDVTDERAARSDLEQSNDRLAELIQSKDEFIASVSHELRTPLTAVVGLAEILSEDADLTEGERADLRAILVSQARHTSTIVDDLLVAARADIGQVSVVAVPCDLTAIVTEALRLTASGLEVSVDVPSGVTVTADPTRMLQVLRNLLTNADRHGGRCLTISAQVEGELVLVTVADDGSGVPDEEAVAIFEPYRRGEEAGSIAGSIGLGLSVSRILARLMGGDVVYRRERGLTVFEFSVPLEVDADGVDPADLEPSGVVKRG